MPTKWKNFILAGLVAAASASMPLCSRADADFSSTDNGGNFGLGVEWGQPGDWGISGKIWLDRVNAFQPAVKFNGGGDVILQLDYLWHAFAMARMSDEGGIFPIYIGLGGNVILQNAPTLAVRVPLGITYIFNRKVFPLDIYFQIAPTLWFYSAGTSLDLYPELGAHIYL